MIVSSAHIRSHHGEDEILKATLLSAYFRKTGHYDELVLRFKARRPLLVKLYRAHQRYEIQRVWLRCGEARGRTMLCIVYGWDAQLWAVDNGRIDEECSIVLRPVQ